MSEVSEKLFQESVMKLCKVNNWKVAHISPSQVRPGVWKSDCKGFPDLVLTSMHQPSRGIVYVELKTNTGKLSAEQVEYAHLIMNAGQEYHIWRPADIDKIIERLSRTVDTRSG